MGDSSQETDNEIMSIIEEYGHDTSPSDEGIILSRLKTKCIDLNCNDVSKSELLEIIDEHENEIFASFNDVVFDEE